VVRMKRISPMNLLSTGCGFADWDGGLDYFYCVILIRHFQQIPISVRTRVRKMIDTPSDVSKIAKYCYSINKLVQYQERCDHQEIME